MFITRFFVVIYVLLSGTMSNAANNIITTIDDHFSSISVEAPEFAGMFRDVDGRLVVATTNLASIPSVKLAIQNEFSTIANKENVTKFNNFSEGLNRSVLPDKIKTKLVEFSYRQLRRWQKQVITVVFEDSNVTMVDLDEQANRIVIGVTDLALSNPLIILALEKLGVPSKAISYVQSESAQLLNHTLKDQFRPVIAGVEINNGRGSCSIGFNSYRGPVRGFVTASHCTERVGFYDGGNIYQPTSPNNKIGNELVDPVFISGGWFCPNGYLCRWSDAAFVNFDNGTGSTLGAIAQPVSASLNINHSNPKFSIVGEATWPLVGDTLHKVGATTGWTAGTVSRTCVNYNFIVVTTPPADRMLLCQNRVDANTGINIVGRGDSGSPVFVRATGSNNVLLSGIVWGSGGGGAYFLFSAMASIQSELGTLTF